VHLCSWCGDPISNSAAEVYLKGDGRYPLLCDSCMLKEMDRKISERRVCESCGGPMEYLRRIAIKRMEHKGYSPQRLCLTCLRKQLDVGVIVPHRFSKDGVAQVLFMDEWGPSSTKTIVCPWCLSSLSSDNIEGLRKGELIRCDYCRTTMTPSSV